MEGAAYEKTTCNMHYIGLFPMVYLKAYMLGTQRVGAPGYSEILEPGNACSQN
jgi:hypothetical protein